MFKEDKYEVIKKAISKKMAEFIYQYFCNKRKVTRLLFDAGYISQFNNDWGVWNDEQIPETYSHYGDMVMETLLGDLKESMETKTGLKLNPTYSYARIYKNGDILERHKDRYSCEVSTTMHLGGDEWPLFLDPSGANSVIDEYKNIHKPGAPKGVRVDLKVGDMLI